MPYDIIFLDWYITLSHSHYYEQLRTAAPHDYEGLSKWLIDHMNVFEDWMRGVMPTTDVARLQSRDLGLSPEYIQQELQKSCEFLALDRPAVLDEIARLRAKGIKVALATDNIPEFSSVTVPAQGLHDHFDAILNSAEQGTLKGDGVTDMTIPFFDRYLTAHDIPYQRALLIDDNNLFTDRYPDAPLRQIRVKDADETIEVLQSLS